MLLFFDFREKTNETTHIFLGVAHTAGPCTQVQLQLDDLYPVLQLVLHLVPLVSSAARQGTATQEGDYTPQ